MRSLLPTKNGFPSGGTFSRNRNAGSGTCDGPHLQEVLCQWRICRTGTQAENQTSGIQVNHSGYDPEIPGAESIELSLAPTNSLLRLFRSLKRPPPAAHEPITIRV